MRLRTQSFALYRLAYSKPEAAEIAAVGLSKIKQAVNDGELAEVELDGRRVIMHDDLRDYLLRHRKIRGNGNGHTGDMPVRADNNTPPAAPPANDISTHKRRRRGRPPRAARSPP